LQELENKTVESFSNSSITCYIIIVIVEQFGSLLESQQQAVKQRAQSWNLTMPTHMLFT